MKALVSFAAAVLAAVTLLNGTFADSASAQSQSPSATPITSVTIHCLRQDIGATEALGVYFKITLQKSGQSQIALQSQRFQVDEDGNPVEHADDKLNFFGQLNCSPVASLKYDFNCENKVSGSAREENAVPKYVVTLIKDSVPASFTFDVRKDCRIQ